MFGWSQTDSLPVFAPIDVFAIEHARDPQISPNGQQVVYQRMRFDIMTDRATGDLWIVNTDGSQHQKLTSRDARESQARWSPTGDRLAFVSSTDEGSEVFMYWTNSGRIARISQLPASPGNLSWSPDGAQLAFTMKVSAPSPVLIKMPARPKGAKWAAPARVTDRLKHEADGSGYVKPGFTHVFVLPSEGGTPRQLTDGDYNHRGPLSWIPDGSALLCSGNRNENWEYEFRNSEVYKVELATHKVTALTDRFGPDYGAVVSPDGSTIAYLGYEDKIQTYQLTRIHLMDIDGTNQRVLNTTFDRSFSNLQWASNSRDLYAMYDEDGDTKITRLSPEGKRLRVYDGVGGTSLGRPYASGSYSVAQNEVIAYTACTPLRPAEVACVQYSATNTRATAKELTALNEDILPFRALGQVEEVNYSSSVDGRRIQGWIVKPPYYDPTEPYPLLVENHGGPILNYGARFSLEMQLYAAAGYLVFYPNPRGSTGYGEEFGNLLYHNYPGDDYQDVMDGVDHLIERGLTSEDQLFVTGGSAGGIMTAWMIGKNNRFEAAVVVKPVMNWISKTLVADNYYGYADYRLPGQPWENTEEYWKFSPISLVENIETPTMVMVGMNDLRTPPSEAKQLYHALKLRRIETVLVEIPGASHGIAARPSNLITKVAHVLAWLDGFKDGPDE